MFHKIVCICYKYDSWLSPPPHPLIPKADNNPTLPLQGKIALLQRTLSPSPICSSQIPLFPSDLSKATTIPHPSNTLPPFSLFCMSFRSFAFRISFFLIPMSSNSLVSRTTAIWYLHPQFPPFTPLSNPVLSLTLLFNYQIYSYKNWDSSVSIVTWLCAELLSNCVWMPGRGNTFFSLIQDIHTGSGDHPVSCSARGTFGLPLGRGDRESGRLATSI